MKRDGSVRYPATECDPGTYLVGAGTLREIQSVMESGFELEIRDHAHVVLRGEGSTRYNRLLRRYRGVLLKTLGPTQYTGCRCERLPGEPAVRETDADYEIRNDVVYHVACDQPIGDAQ